MVQKPLAPFQAQYDAQPSADIVATVNRYNPESPMNEQQVIAANAIMSNVQTITPAPPQKAETGTQSLSLQSRLQQQIAIQTLQQAREDVQTMTEDHGAA